jgi:arylsulfatase A-like enzyme
VYGNNTDWRKAIDWKLILPEYLKGNGYRTYASGKIFHHHGEAFQAYEAFTDYLPFPSITPDLPMPESNLNGYQHWYSRLGEKRQISPNFDWGVWPKDPADHVDHRTVEWAIDQLSHAQGPFFIATGIFRPHMPFFVPKEYLDQYPLDKLVLPEIRADDLNDLPAEATAFIKRPGWAWLSTMAHEKKRDPLTYEKAVQGYQASATFADHQLGRLLDALDRSGQAGKTIIILWSDHGYHLGEKEHWEKFILYEKTTHVPFIIVAPGYSAGQVSRRPVSLIDVYPTVAELCGLPAPSHLEGTSLVPLLKEPARIWHPALMTSDPGNHAVRSDRYRYIHYAQGAEELYDTENDSNEWQNIADQPGSRAIMDELARWLPKTNAHPVGPVSAH